MSDIHEKTMEVAKNRSCQIEMVGQQGTGGGGTLEVAVSVVGERPCYPNEPSSPASTHISSHTLTTSLHIHIHFTCHRLVHCTWTAASRWPMLL